MLQSVEVIKKPASQRIAYPRNLISEHRKCFLQFEAFPISAQSYCLPIHRQITFYCWTTSNNRLPCVEISHRDGISPHFHGQRKSVWNEHLYLPSDFPSWSCWGVPLPTHYNNTFMHCVSSCSLVSLGWKKTCNSYSKKKRRETKLFQVSDPAFLLLLFLYCPCLALHVFTCAVCMHACTVWLWGCLIKYSPALLLHNAVMFLHTLIAEFVTPDNCQLSLLWIGDAYLRSTSPYVRCQIIFTTPLHNSCTPLIVRKLWTCVFSVAIYSHN